MKLPSFIEKAAAHRLLKIDEELDLARKYREGAVLDSNGYVLKPTAKGLRAGQTIVECHFRLALQQAHKFSGLGVPLDDLFQAAVLGLLAARDRFDPGQGFRFMTYAIYWIRAKINRHLSQFSTEIHIPPARCEAFDSAMSWAQKLWPQESERQHIQRVADDFGIALEEAECIRFRRTLMVSGNKPVGETKIQFQDTLPSPDPLPDEITEKKQQDAMIRQAVKASCETKKERDIAKRRILAEDEQTLQQIGDSHGISRERVRQIQAKVLARTASRVKTGRR